MCPQGVSISVYIINICVLCRTHILRNTWQRKKKTKDSTYLAARELFIDHFIIVVMTSSSPPPVQDSMYLLYTIYVSCAGHTAKYVAARKKTKDSKKKKDSMYLTAREGGAKSDLFVCPKCGAKDGYTHTHTQNTHAHTHTRTHTQTDTHHLTVIYIHTCICTCICII